MTNDQLNQLKARAEKRTICTGLGGEETFVGFNHMVIARQTVIDLIEENLRLKEGLQDAICFMKDAKRVSIASRAIQLESEFFGGV